MYIIRHRSFTNHHSNTARTACSQVSQDKVVLRSARSKTSILNSQMGHLDGPGKRNTKSSRQRGTREPSLSFFCTRGLSTRGAAQTTPHFGAMGEGESKLGELFYQVAVSRHARKCECASSSGK